MEYFSELRVVICIKVTLVTYCDAKNLVTTHSQTSLNTSCIVSLFNPIELWSIAMPCDGQ